MRRIPLALTVAAVAIFIPGTAGAQQTTCMRMGPDMVTCNTTGVQDGGTALGKGIGDLIASISENNLRKKVGQLLADGDCEGAARLALEKGRLEMGLAIRETCAAAAVQQQSTALSTQLQSIAAQTRTPSPYGEGLTVTSVQAAGTQLWITAQYERTGEVPIEQRNAAMTDICGSEPLAPLLQAGASVRVFYLAPDGTRLANDDVTARVCGRG